MSTLSFQILVVHLGLGLMVGIANAKIDRVIELLESQPNKVQLNQTEEDPNQCIWTIKI